MQRAIFPVGYVPYAVWEWDLKERNVEFIKQIDEQYFVYLALIHFNAIEGEDRSRAALALRSSYHHAIETLMVLMGATVQAPHCYPGWIQKASMGTVRAVVRALSDEKPMIPSALSLSKPSWDELSEKMFRCAGWGSEKEATAKRFAHGWHMLAHEWLEQRNIDEYNSIKHGLRVTQGGFTLAAGIQDDPETPAPPERVRLVGGSEFGSEFFVAEGLADPSYTKGNPHFRIRRTAVGWSPRAMVRAMQLVSISITNIKSFALILSGVAPSTVHFTRPTDARFFDELWSVHPSIASMSIDTVVSEADIQRHTREELQHFIDRNFRGVGESTGNETG